MPDTQAPQYRSARETARALREREISAVALLEATIARIEALDSAINAVVVRDFERARSAARTADVALACGTEGAPLLGVPMTVKESFDVAGLPTTWGIAQFRDFRPREDSVVVARLKAAGAIVIGKTNVPLALMDWQSFNDIYGTTSNPWDLTRTPGGSSGGAAAALAAGFTALEIGSDIGGSIRVPASYCGVYGHKPSYGLVPTRGQNFPQTEPTAIDLGVAGPLARSAGDLELALDVIAGPDEGDATGYRLALPPARHAALRDYRVLCLETHPLEPTSREVTAALRRASDCLERTGAGVVRSSELLPDAAESARVYTSLLAAATTGGNPPSFYRHIQGKVDALDPGDGSLAACRLRGIVATHREWLALDARRTRIRRRWHEFFRSFDVVLCPVMPTTAFPHDHNPSQSTRRIDIDGALLPYDEQIAWPSLATLGGLPATAVPLGCTAGGLPVGMQIIGPYLEDRTPLRLAALLEREMGGFVAPPAYR